MSNVSTTHSVVSYVPGKTKALDGQRLAKMTYKTDKETGIKPDSKAVSIPVIKWDSVAPHLAALQGEFLAVVHRAQDGLIRGLVEAGKSEVTDEAINISAVVAYMLEDGGRLTGDTIREWFKESLAEPLMLTFASKLGISEDSTPTTEQENKLAAILKGYEDSFAKLASGAASFNDMQKTNMIKAMELSGLDSENDSLTARFTERLNKKSDDSMLMNL